MTQINTTKEILNIGLKGPLLSATQNNYVLIIIDKHSRFPFVFPCSNIWTQTVIKCLNKLFSLCGTPGYINSDRGLSFISREICPSLTTPYHPTGNAQFELYNGVGWKSVRLALKIHSFSDSHWEMVLPDASHSFISLLSTSTQLHMRDSSVFSVDHHVEPHFRHGCLHQVL